MLVREGQAVVRPVARLRISFDERIEDGFNAIRAMAALRGYLEDPATLAGPSAS